MSKLLDSRPSPPGDAVDGGLLMSLMIYVYKEISTREEEHDNFESTYCPKI